MEDEAEEQIANGLSTVRSVISPEDPEEKDEITEEGFWTGRDVTEPEDVDITVTIGSGVDLTEAVETEQGEDGVRHLGVITPEEELLNDGNGRNCASSHWYNEAFQTAAASFHVAIVYSGYQALSIEISRRHASPTNVSDPFAPSRCTCKPNPSPAAMLSIVVIVIAVSTNADCVPLHAVVAVA